MQVPVQLHIPGTRLQNFILPAFINSGSADCFIDAVAAQILQIPLQYKATPDLVESTDSSSLSSDPVTEETSPLEAMIQGHQEVLQFGVIHSPQFPLTQSISRLALHTRSFGGKHGKSVFHQSFVVYSSLPRSKLSKIG